MDERGRKGITLERRIKRFWAGRGAVRRDGRNARDARRSIAWDVDGSERKGAKLERKEKRDWVGRGSARRDSHCWNLRKTWMNANPRAQNSNGEQDVLGWVRGALGDFS